MEKTFENVKEMSESQKEAAGSVDAKTDLCVTASAGSGKTTVLVERFLSILENRKDISVENILAITFTERAANTMKNRIRQGIVRKISEARGAGEKERYEEFLRGLENSYIGTIHSFASRVLKENPLEAGVEPAFNILSPGMDSVLMDRVLDNVIAQAVCGEEALDLLARYEEDNVRGSLKEIYSKARSIEIGTDSLTVNNRSDELEKVLADFGSVVKRLSRYGCDSKDSASTINAVNAAKEMVSEGLTDLTAEVVDEAAINRIASFFGNGKITERVKTELREDVKLLKKEIFENLALLTREKLSLRDRETFLGLLKKFSQLYDEEKGKNSVLDFDDLLWKVYRIFSSEDTSKRSVLKNYRKKFRYVMVDEFQDTSRIQTTIIKSVSEGNNLFFVGDEKQSIYGFRNADVESFRGMIGAVTEKGGRHILLDENFRSREHLVSFVNFLFNDVWSGVADGISYKEIKAMADYPRDNSCGRCVESISVPKSSEDEEGAGREEEARRLALRLRQIVGEGKIFVKEGEMKYRMRPVRYRDIALLFRSMRDAHFYEEALGRYGVPYYAVKGGDFFRRMEVRDCVNFLKAVDDPYPDIPMAGLLKSPFAGISDDALFRLRDPRTGEGRVFVTPLYDSIRKVNAREEKGWRRGISAADREKIAGFLRIFEEAVSKKDSLPISELLEFIIAASKYDVKVLGKYNGKRRFANVRKLVEIAREFGKREFFTLKEFIRYVEKLKEEEVQESEAQVELEEGGDSVKLCTIHRAKGLEFPVVVLADAGRRFVRGETGTFSFDDAGKIGIKYRSVIDGSFRETKSFKEQREKRSRDNTAELKRLFYVAVTRARDHLVFSGTIDMKRDSAGFAEKGYDKLDSFMAWVELISKKIARKEAAGDDLGFVMEEFYDQPVNVRNERTLTLGHKRPSDIYERYFGEKPLVSAAGEKKRLIKQIENIKKIERTQEIDFSITPILIYRKCPRHYFRSVILREPDLEYESETLFSGEEGEERMARNEFGEFFHQLMRRADFLARDFKKEAELVLRRTAGGIFPEDKKELIELVADFSRHEVFGTIKESFREGMVYREAPFLYRAGQRTVLKGVIDLLYREKKGGWVILDYKTNKITAKDVEEKSAFYDLQLLAYACAVKKTIGETPKKLFLYFAVPGVLKEIAVSDAILKKADAEIEEYKRRIAAGDFKGCGNAGCKYCTGKHC